MYFGVELPPLGEPVSQNETACSTLDLFAYPTEEIIHTLAPSFARTKTNHMIAYRAKFSVQSLVEGYNL